MYSLEYHKGFIFKEHCMLEFKFHQFVDCWGTHIHTDVENQNCTNIHTYHDPLVWRIHKYLHYTHNYMDRWCTTKWESSNIVRASVWYVDLCLHTATVLLVVICILLLQSSYSSFLTGYLDHDWHSHYSPIPMQCVMIHWREELNT